MEKQKTPSIIINQIEVKPLNRQITDIGKWRQALRAADRHKKTALFNLYEDILTDGVLGDAIDKRIRAVTGADLTFQYKDGSEQQQMIDFIDTDEFEHLLEEILKALFWGVSLIELTFENKQMNVESIPRKHIRELTKTIARLENDPEGNISYQGMDVVEVLPKKQKHGLILRACPYAILKKGGIGDWAQMVELFGMPLRIGKYSIYDAEARKALQEAFNNQGAAPTLIVPKETDIETTVQTGNGGGTLYKDFIATMDEQILIAILSQTMTTKDGASRSQGQVHKEVEEEVNKHDLRFVQRILNHKVKPILEARGYPVKNGTFIFPKATEKLTVEELVKLSEILEIPTYYFQEKYGIPAAEITDIVARRNTHNPPKENNTPPKEEEEEEETEEEDEDPKNKKKLFDFFAYAPTKRSGASQLNTIQRWANSIQNLKDSIATNININKLFNKAVADIYKKYGQTPPSKYPIDKHLFEISNTAYQRAIDKTFSVQFAKQNPEFLNEFRHNAAVFSAFKNHRQTKEIIEQLYDEKGNLRSFYKFKKELLGKKINKNYNKNWLQTEYNMAVRAARTAEKFKGYIKTKHLYPNLEYLESSAANQRTDHLEYVGTILPIDHKWWDTHLPPSEWGCECSFRNTNKPPTKVPQQNKTINPVFAHNPAKTAHFVNAKEHPYIKGVCTQFSTCKYRKNTKKQLTDPPNKPECKLCLLAKMWEDKKREEDIAKDKAKTIVAIREKKEAIHQYNGETIKSEKFETGKMTVLRRSLNDIFEHAIEDKDIRKWLQTYNINSLKSLKYRGWAANRPYPKKHPKYDPNNPNKPKHDTDTYWFYYYTIIIEEKEFWVNVKMHKNFGEVVYTIEKEKPKDLITGHKKK